MTFKKYLSPELLERFQPNLPQSLLGLYGFNLFQMEDQTVFKKGRKLQKH